MLLVRFSSFTVYCCLPTIHYFYHNASHATKHFVSRKDSDPLSLFQVATDEYIHIVVMTPRPPGS